MTIYPRVSRICTPRRSVHLRYPCISVHPPLLINNVLGGCDWPSWEMPLEAEIEWTQRCTWRPSKRELRDALGGRDRMSLEMHFEAMIERGWRCNWRPRLSELRDALGGRDWASLEMHLQAMINRDWRSTRKRSIWREALLQLRLYSLVNLQSWEYWELSTTTSAARWETGWGWETVDLGLMLYLMYAVLGVESWSWHGDIVRDDLTSCS